MIARLELWFAQWGMKLLFLAALLVAAAAGGCYYGEQGQMAKTAAANVELAKAETNLGSCQGSNKALQTAIGDQNTAIQALGKAGDDRKDAGKKAVDALAPQLTRIEAAIATSQRYQRRAGTNECDAARTIVERDNAKK
jgi:uncharacterized protein HemX